MSPSTERDGIYRELRSMFIDAAGPDHHQPIEAFEELGIDRKTSRQLAEATRRTRTVADADEAANYWADTISNQRADLRAKQHDPAALAADVPRW